MFTGKEVNPVKLLSKPQVYTYIRQEIKRRHEVWQTVTECKYIFVISEEHSHIWNWIGTFFICSSDMCAGGTGCHNEIA